MDSATPSSALAHAASSPRQRLIQTVCSLLLLATTVCPAHAASTLDEIDTMWRNTTPIAHDRCLYFIVKAWSDQVLRGRLSPHDCVVFAVQEYRRGDHEHAMGWLQAGLCPDREGQQRLVHDAPRVFEHLVKVYSPMVP